LVSDASLTLSTGARIGRAGVAAASGVVGTVVGIAVGGVCEVGAIGFTAGASSPVCVVAGIGAAAGTNWLLGHFVNPRVDSAFGWNPQNPSDPRC